MTALVSLPPWLELEALRAEGEGSRMDVKVYPVFPLALTFDGGDRVKPVLLTPPPEGSTLFWRDTRDKNNKKWIGLDGTVYPSWREVAKPLFDAKERADAVPEKPPPPVPLAGPGEWGPIAEPGPEMGGVRQLLEPTQGGAGMAGVPPSRARQEQMKQGYWDEKRNPDQG